MSHFTHAHRIQPKICVLAGVSTSWHHKPVGVLPGMRRIAGRLRSYVARSCVRNRARIPQIHAESCIQHNKTATMRLLPSCCTRLDRPHSTEVAFLSDRDGIRIEGNECLPVAGTHPFADAGWVQPTTWTRVERVLTRLASHADPRARRFRNTSLTTIAPARAGQGDRVRPAHCPGIILTSQEQR